MKLSPNIGFTIKSEDPEDGVWFSSEDISYTLNPSSSIVNNKLYQKVYTIINCNYKNGPCRRSNMFV